MRNARVASLLIKAIFWEIELRYKTERYLIGTLIVFLLFTVGCRWQ